MILSKLAWDDWCWWTCGKIGLMKAEKIKPWFYCTETYVPEPRGPPPAAGPQTTDKTMVLLYRDTYQGHEVSSLHDGGEFLASVRAWCDLLPQQVPGGQVGEAVLLHDLLALRTLTATRAACYRQKTFTIFTVRKRSLGQGNVFTPVYHFVHRAVADPGFPRGGGANSPGVPTYDFAKFFQKLHEIERIWTDPQGGAHPKFYYVDPPLLT